MKVLIGRNLDEAREEFKAAKKNKRVPNKKHEKTQVELSKSEQEKLDKMFVDMLVKMYKAEKSKE